MLNNEIRPEFNYDKIGSGEKKIICIHGFGASRKTFYDILPYFDDSYEIYLMDLIGFGDSKFVEGWDYTIENQAKLLYAFLKEKNLRNVTLIGHSYGGGVSLLLLVMLRELSEKNLIKNAVLIGPACYPQKIPFFIQLPAKIPKLYRMFMTLMPKKILGKFMLKKLYINKELITKVKIERYASYFSRSDNIKCIIKTAKRIIPENINEVVSNMKNINVPILILWGEKDFIIKKKQIFRLHEDISNSKLITVMNTGHVVQEEKPETVFNAIDNFL